MTGAIDLTRHRHRDRHLTQRSGHALGLAQRKAAPYAQVFALQPRPPEFELMQAFARDNQGRLAALVPERIARMKASPFRFFRGWPRLMAEDLMREADSGLVSQVCGDCHLLNFGAFGSPERHLLFGLNDFDESVRGPFEWDLKRLASSAVIAAGQLQLAPRQSEAVVEQVLCGYLARLRDMLDDTPLDSWYDREDVPTMLAHIKPDSIRAERARQFDLSQAKSPDKLIRKLTERPKKNAPLQFIEQFPDSFHAPAGDPLADRWAEFFGHYRLTLAADRQVLLDRYQLSDVALRVVGIGSVGTRCAMAIFEDGDHEPLLLQIKQARPSIYAGRVAERFAHQGQRVVAGQQLLQAASDIFLGYATAQDGSEYYVRQLRDLKITLDLEELDHDGLLAYAYSCGRALGHAHGKASHVPTLLGYLGAESALRQALCRYATAQAARTVADHQQFLQALDSGQLDPVGQP